MCGIVGLFIKNPALEPQLGSLVSKMLGTMCERGPNSAGFAVYGAPSKGKSKITLQSAEPGSFKGLAERIKKELGVASELAPKSSHAVLTLPSDKLDTVLNWLRTNVPEIRIMGSGEAIEIYKEVGYPTDVASGSTSPR